MMLDHPDLKVNIQKAHSLLDRRYAERVPIRYRITYSGEEGARIVTGEGALKDLSKTGCKIFGATTISLASRLTLLLDLEDGQAPMRLTNVLVSWIDRDSFAVRFPKLSPEERKRLQEVILENIRVSSLGNHRTAFRIVSQAAEKLLWHGGNLVCFVYLVDLVHLVSFVQPNKRDKPNKPNNDLRMLADFFSILLSVDPTPRSKPWFLTPPLPSP